MSDSPIETADDLEFLYDLLDRALEQVEDGLPPDLDALLAGRVHLRDRALEMIRRANRISAARVWNPPTVPGYAIIGELGQGGMGAVYLARQERLGGRPVALKVLPPSLQISDRARRRFSGEALAIGRLRHPNIVSIYDVVDEHDVVAYAMEWIDGSSLAQSICHTASAVAQPDVAAVARLGSAIASALAAVHHAGLVHRDVKPSNILSRADDTPLLSDFGLVREADSTLTQPGQFAGTVTYAAPEQLHGKLDAIDARSDIYSLGVTLFHALALRPPFDGDNPVEILREIERGPRTPLRRLNRRVPRDLETIVMRAMDPDPAQRYQTADQLADDLDRFRSFQPIRARRTGTARRLVKFARRNRSAAIGLVVGSILSLVIGAATAVYVFMVPHWIAAHLTDARLALLDPALGNQIFLVQFFGNETRGTPATSPAALRTALDAYDRALRWAPWDDAIRRERAVVQRANDAAENPRSRPEPDDLDPRSRGLYALLTGDPASALHAWSGIDSEHDPNPLVAAAKGILYLAGGEHGRAYLPLRDACQALPDVGFLTVYQADAAVQCGDLDRAARLLAAARHLPRPDPLGSLERVEADLAAAAGRVADAERLYRRITGNPVAQLRLARLYESAGRLTEAVQEYRRVRAVVPNGPKPRAEFIVAAERWWSSIEPGQRLRLICAAPDDSTNGPTALPGLLRDVASATRPNGDYSNARSVSLPSTFFPTIRTPSLEHLSLVELADRLEVEDMSHWSRMTSYPRFLKTLQISAWRSPWPKTASRYVERLAGLAAVAVALISGGGITQADVADFDYNFEDLKPGDINGQDGWVVTNGVAWVQTGPGVNSSKTVHGPVFGPSEAFRPLPEPFHYTAADTAVVWRFQGLVGFSCCNSSSIFAVLGQTTNFGLDKTPDGLLKARLSAGPVSGDTLEFAHWYEMKLTVDFSVSGGLATLAYRDLTLNEQAFTTDSILRNINLNASPDGQGRYTFHAAFTRQDSANEVCFVDNIHLDAPSPPCPGHTGDMNADTAVDGRDLQRFSAAIIANSIAFADTCPGDFSGNGAVDGPDVPGFVSVLLGP